MAWFKGGFGQTTDEMDKNKVEREKHYENMNTFDRNQRFYIKAGGEPRKIIFLDDFSHKHEGAEIIPFSYYEHVIELNGDFKTKEHTPCMKNSESCWLCDPKNFKSKFVGVCTILDITQYTNKEGKLTITPRKKIWAGNQDAVMLLQSKRDRRLDKQEDLQGAQFIISRFDKKQPTVGADYDFDTLIPDVPKYLTETLGLNIEKLDLKPYGLTADETFEYYKELLGPRSKEFFEQLWKKHQCLDSLTSFDRKKGGSTGNTPSAPSVTY